MTKIGIIQKEGTVTMHRTGGLYKCRPKREDQEEYWGKRKTSDEVDKPFDKERATNGREGLDK